LLRALGCIKRFRKRNTSRVRRGSISPDLGGSAGPSIPSRLLAARFRRRSPVRARARPGMADGGESRRASRGRLSEVHTRRRSVTCGAFSEARRANEDSPDGASRAPFEESCQSGIHGICRDLRVRCRAHNQLWAEQAFGREHVERHRHFRQRKCEAIGLSREDGVQSKPSQADDTLVKLRGALQRLGFRESDARRAVATVARKHAQLPCMEEALREALQVATAGIVLTAAEHE
jgi:hypothetical protein